MKHQTSMCVVLYRLLEFSRHIIRYCDIIYTDKQNLMMLFRVSFWWWC